MELQQNKSENILAPLKKVTPLSKYFSLFLFVILPFLGGLIGYKYMPDMPEKIVTIGTIADTPDVLPTDSKNSYDKITTTSDVEGVKDINMYLDESGKYDPVTHEIVDAYKSGKYRTVAVAQNPYYSKDSKYDSVVIVSIRGVNDYSCGSKYLSRTCYIFLESSSFGVETPKFVGAWQNGGIVPEKIKFNSPFELQIEVAESNICYEHNAIWIYDLSTGSSTIKSSETTSGGC